MSKHLSGARADHEAFTPSRFIIRLLDRRRKLDYGVAFAVGAWPALFAYLIGAHWTIGRHLGYWDSPNWWSLAILLPAVLFVFRLLMARIIPVGLPWPVPVIPPIVNLVQGETARQAVYEALRQRVLSTRNVAVPLVVTLIVHAADAPNWVASYLGTGSAAPSWATMFEVNPQISVAENLLLTVFAGVAQFSIVFLGMLTIVLLFRHNVFFVGNIYQRRWVSPREEARFFQINPKDVNRCFGFRIANVAFNAQVQALMVAGAAMLLSRYASVNTEVLRWPPKLPEFGELFPLPSQWLMALSWMVALAVVALPGIVKLLPRVPGRGAERVELSISNYLREFFSDQAWPKDKTGRDESNQQVAARFARNAFWPTGDNRAGVLFFFAFWVFFTTLLPASINDPLAFAVALILFAALAYGARMVTFALLELSLHYVDETLVSKNVALDELLDDADPHSDRTHGLGMFISYRRRDSAPYARSLHECLLDTFRADRIFMDITDIAPGDNFARKIDQALDVVDAVIVLIGEKWLTTQDERSQPRIQDPADMVHIEVASALRRGKRVIPVLVGGAKMPAVAALPEPLKGLAALNAVELSDTRWAYDVGRLIDALKES